MGQNNLAVLTGDRINEGFFFFTRKCMAVLSGGLKKSGRNNEEAVRRGSTERAMIAKFQTHFR